MNNAIVPEYLFFTRGTGRHADKLRAFELALQDAGIASYNLVEVSSIMPPACKIISRKKGVPMLKHGQIVHCVLARNSTDEQQRLVSAAVGLAVPAGPEQYGYLSEYHAFGKTLRQTSSYAEDLAVSMLAATLGIEKGKGKGPEERKRSYRVSGKIVKSDSVCQSAKGRNGMWTTVVVAAVLI
jgi:arginine decarboxylase